MLPFHYLPGWLDISPRANHQHWSFDLDLDSLLHSFSSKRINVSWTSRICVMSFPIIPPPHLQKKPVTQFNHFWPQLHRRLLLKYPRSRPSAQSSWNEDEWVILFVRESTESSSCCSIHLLGSWKGIKLQESKWGTNSGLMKIWSVIGWKLVNEWLVVSWFTSDSQLATNRRFPFIFLFFILFLYVCQMRVESCSCLFGVYIYSSVSS